MRVFHLGIFAIPMPYHKIMNKDCMLIEEKKLEETRQRKIVVSRRYTCFNQLNFIKPLNIHDVFLHNS